MKDKIEVSTIRNLKRTNTSDELMMKQLGISQRTLTKYKERLQESERQELEDIILGDVAYEILEYIDSLHNTIASCKEIGKSSSTIEKMEAERMKLFCHNELIRLMQSGPQILAQTQVAPALRKAFNNIKNSGQEIVDVAVERIDKPEQEAGEEKKHTKSRIKKN